jgi:hypothetical protein
MWERDCQGETYHQATGTRSLLAGMTLYPYFYQQRNFLLGLNYIFFDSVY